MKPYNTQDFNDLIDKTFKLYLNMNLNTFQLDNTIYEVIEDENDGYRSAMRDVLIIDNNAPARIFLADIKVQRGSGRSFEGYELVEIKDNHIWLLFGTEDYDDYYPTFIYDWRPKERVVKISNIIDSM